jgi:iron uptake system EfeUOB component EfeO/EfeM
MRKLLYVIVSSALLSGTACAQNESASDKAGNAWDATKQKTKEAAHDVADASRNVAGAVVETVAPDKDAHRVKVDLTGDSLDMPRSVNSGKTAFVVKNSGTEKQNFEITGKGIDREFVFAISPKETKTLQVDLQPGHYKALCTVTDHKTRKMKINLVVR